MAREVVVKFLIQDDGTTKVLDDAGKKLDDIGKNATGATAPTAALTGNLTNLAKTAAGVAVVGVAIKQLGDFLVSTIQPAAEAQRAQALLENSLRATGQASASYLQQLNAQGQALSRVTTFTDEQIATSQRQLVLMGATRQQVELLTPKILDMAVAFDRDLGGATLAVGKALQGNFTQFQRFGVQINENASQAEKLAQVMAFLERTSGSARTEANQLGGSIENLSKEWGELKESIGLALENTFNISGAMNALAGAIRGVSEAINGVDLEKMQAVLDARIEAEAAAAGAPFSEAEIAAGLSRQRGAFVGPRQDVTTDPFVGPIEDPNAAVQRVVRNQEAAIAERVRGASEANTRALRQQRDEREQILRLQRQEENQAQALVIRAESQVSQLEEQLRVLEEQGAGYDDLLRAAGRIDDAQRAAIDAQMRQVELSEEDVNLRNAKLDALEKEKEALGAVAEVQRRMREDERRAFDDAQRRTEEAILRNAGYIENAIGAAGNARSVQELARGLGSPAFGEISSRLAISAAAGLSGETVPVDANGLSMGAGGISAASMYTAFVAMALGAISEGVRSFNANKYDLTLSRSDIQNKAYGDAVAGAFDALGMGGIGNLLGGAAEKSPAWVQEMLTPFVSPWFMNALGLFRAPSRATQVKDFIESSIRENSQFFPLQQDIVRGGHSGVDTKFFELPITMAEAARFGQMGFAPLHDYGSLQGAGPTLDRLYGQLAGAAQPGVSELRFGSALGLSQVLLGSTGKDTDVAQASNAMVNNLIALGISAKEADAEIRALADDFGVTLPGALLELRKQGLEGNIDSIEQFTAGLMGVADIFKEDLPRGVDIAGAALRNMFEGPAGNIVFNARDALADIQDQIDALARSEARIAGGEGFQGTLTGVRDVLQGDIFSTRASMLTGRRQYNYLSNAYSTRAQAGLNILGMLDRSADTGILTDMEQRLAGEAFESSRGAILSQIDLAASRYGAGTSRYKKAVAPLLVQLGKLDTYAALLADDTQRMIDAEKSNTDRIVAAIEARNNSTVTINIDGGSYTVGGADDTHLQGWLAGVLANSPLIRAAVQQTAQGA